MSEDLGPAFELFEAELRQHTPSSEAGVREILADSLRAGMGLERAEVEVEASLERKRLDILVHHPPTAIELKYHRAMPSGHSRPMTAQYGQLLADIRKLATFDGSRRLAVLVTDDAGLTHLRNKAQLPVSPGQRRGIRSAGVAGLAQSARGPATADGSWIDVDAQLIWKKARVGAEGLYIFVWTIEPKL